MSNLGWQSLTASEYHAAPGCSYSRLTKLLRSPAHLQHELTNPRSPTPAMVFGSALHTFVLRPQDFDREFAILPEDLDRRTKAGKELFEEFSRVNAGKSFLKHEDYDALVAMRDALLAHDSAGALINNISHAERCGFWKERDTLCKMMVDASSDRLETIFDLKTTQNASRYAFERSIFDYGYHRQGAWYLRGSSRLGKQFKHYVIITVETEAPYAVATYRLKPDAIELGERENIQLFDLYRDCLQNNFWPGYPDAIQDIGLPAWAAKRIEKEMSYDSSIGY